MEVVDFLPEKKILPRFENVRMSYIFENIQDLLIANFLLVNLTDCRQLVRKCTRSDNVEFSSQVIFIYRLESILWGLLSNYQGLSNISPSLCYIIQNQLFRWSSHSLWR